MIQVCQCCHAVDFDRHTCAPPDPVASLEQVGGRKCRDFDRIHLTGCHQGWQTAIAVMRAEFPPRCCSACRLPVSGHTGLIPEVSKRPSDDYWLPRRVPFHRYLGLEAFEVTEDRGDGKHAPIALEPQDTVLRGNVTLNRELIPFIGMADIVDRDVVVLAPEKGDGGKSLAVPEHVERGGLTLALCHHPMLDANEQRTRTPTARRRSTEPAPG